MIDWCDSMLRTWGIAKRKLDGIGGKPRKGEKDGLYPCGNARSFMGRFREGGHVGKGKDQTRVVEPLEGLRGDALSVSLALKRALEAGDLKDKNYELLYVQYVIKPRNHKKFKHFKMKRHEYYMALHELQNRLAAWITT